MNSCNHTTVISQLGLLLTFARATITNISTQYASFYLSLLHIDYQSWCPAINSSHPVPWLGQQGALLREV